ncbi:hypothetical protein T06_11642 [Trichinella sp. T6]|nr:hypothetical protein T06_11642 [Trichinella sp. T6]
MEFGKNFHALIQVVHSSIVCNYAGKIVRNVGLNYILPYYYCVPALLADLQFSLGFSDLC